MIDFTGHFDKLLEELAAQRGLILTQARSLDFEQAKLKMKEYVDALDAAEAKLNVVKKQAQQVQQQFIDTKQKIEEVQRHAAAAKEHGLQRKAARPAPVVPSSWSPSAWPLNAAQIAEAVERLAGAPAALASAPTASLSPGDVAAMTSGSWEQSSTPNQAPVDESSESPPAQASGAPVKRKQGDHVADIESEEWK